MKDSDSENFVLRIFYAILALFIALISGGLLFAFLRYFFASPEAPKDDVSPDSPLVFPD